MKTEKKHPKKRIKVKRTETNIKEAAKDTEEKLFDFGGLPDRNLKKNMGCG